MSSKLKQTHRDYDVVITSWSPVGRRPEKLLEAVRVGLMVNNPKFDDPRCAEPVAG